MKKIPRRIEGEIDYVHGRMQDAIKKGMPEVGWEGDPLLSLAYDRRDDCWLVRDHAFSPPQVILRKRAEGIRDLDFRDLCIRLKNAQFKGQGVMSIVDRMEARNAAKEQEERRLIRANAEESAERLAWAFARALDS